MATDLFTFVGLYDKALGSVAHLLDRGEAFAIAQGEPPEAMLDWRLIGDMHPLRFQAGVVVNFAQRWTARVAGRPEPEVFDPASDLAGLRAAIAQARGWLATVTREQLAARDDEMLTFPVTDTIAPTMPGGQWLSVFATTNIQFHLSMVYAILRMKGVPIGKIDLFAGGL